MHIFSYAMKQGKKTFVRNSLSSIYTLIHNLHSHARIANARYFEGRRRCIVCYHRRSFDRLSMRLKITDRYICRWFDHKNCIYFFSYKYRIIFNTNTIAALILKYYHNLFFFFFCFFRLTNRKRLNRRINHWKGQRRWLDFESFASFFDHPRPFVSFLKIIVYAQYGMYLSGYGEIHQIQCHKYHWSEATAMLCSIASSTIYDWSRCTYREIAMKRRDEINKSWRIESCERSCVRVEQKRRKLYALKW